MAEVQLAATEPQASDLEALLSRKPIPIVVGPDEAKGRFRVEGLSAIVRRFADEPGFRVLLGCQKCKTSCCDGAACTCCGSSMHMQSPHRRLVRVAALLQALQDRQQMPVLFSADDLAARERSYSDEDLKAVERYAAVRMRPMRP
jgi:hypothetical protein